VRAEPKGRHQGTGLRLYPQRPVLICSGHLPTEVERIASSGQVRFLPKPFGPSELVRVLSEELRACSRAVGFPERTGRTVWDRMPGM